MTCASCATALPPDAAVCPACGRQTPTKAPLHTLSGLRTLHRDAPATAVLDVGSVFAERYEVIRSLGAGSMGIVYLATDRLTGVQLVLKLIHPGLVVGEAATKHLLDEGLTARAIRHPSIVAVYDVATWLGQPYFTMEHVAGRTLRAWLNERLRDDRDVPLSVAVAIVRAILAPLAEAHRVGVVHRDLKPDNVMLVSEPNERGAELKLLDFGIARALGPASGTSAQHSRGSGTPFYAPPDQFVREDAKPSADLYALSVMFYELLMHSPPQAAHWEPVSRHRDDVPAGLDALLEKGMSARPLGRFRSVEEFETALDLAVGSSRSATATSSRPKPAPTTGSHTVPTRREAREPTSPQDIVPISIVTQSDDSFSAGPLFTTPQINDHSDVVGRWRVPLAIGLVLVIVVTWLVTSPVRESSSDASSVGRGQPAVPIEQPRSSMPSQSAMTPNSQLLTEQEQGVVASLRSSLEGLWQLESSPGDFLQVTVPFDPNDQLVLRRRDRILTGTGTDPRLGGRVNLSVGYLSMDPVRLSLNLYDFESGAKLATGIGSLLQPTDSLVVAFVLAVEGRADYSGRWRVHRQEKRY